MLFFIVAAIFLGAYAKFGRADSIICDDLIAETLKVDEAGRAIKDFMND